MNENREAINSGRRAKPIQRDLRRSNRSQGLWLGKHGSWKLWRLHILAANQRHWAGIAVLIEQLNVIAKTRRGNRHRVVSADDFKGRLGKVMFYRALRQQRERAIVHLPVQPVLARARRQSKPNVNGGHGAEI